MTCPCPSCQSVPHTSSCAVHNGPAMPVGECSCGAEQLGIDWAEIEAGKIADTVLDFDTFCNEHFVRSADIAAALRAAHKRGMVDGLEEAAGLAAISLNTSYATHKIRARITELES
jgi:hypothetical protein